MNTTNHSQKPWRIWQNRVAPNQTEIEIYDAQNYKLANIAHWKDEGEEESRANAHLIASAPEMKDALQAICDAFGDQDSLLIDQAKAALSKAKGEA
jgi:hypothetical protein